MTTNHGSAMHSEYFHLRATKSFLSLLTVLYFIVPSLLAEYLFHNTFNIYLTQYQALGNLLSVIFGVILLLWIYFVIPFKVLRTNRFTTLVSKQPLFKIAYFIFLVYLVITSLYGIKLRMSGAGRLQLFHGEGNFLIPGMGYLLLAAAIYCVAAKSTKYLTAFVVLSVITDAIFAGKIFTFIAVGALFLRLDYQNVDRHKFKRIFYGTCILGFAGMVTLAIARTYMAGGELGAGLLASTYLAMEEFMGVQASVGWAIAYHVAHLPMDLFTFTYSLQRTYINDVGYGLALSPVAYFVGNFGNLALAVAVATLAMIGLVARIARKQMAWIVYLIIVLNFSHFLRDGVNIFLEKLFTQLIFLFLLDRFTVMLMHISNHERELREAQASANIISPPNPA